MVLEPLFFSYKLMSCFAGFVAAGINPAGGGSTQGGGTCPGSRVSKLPASTGGWTVWAGTLLGGEC